jgi:hypothetical protein
MMGNERRGVRSFSGIKRFSPGFILRALRRRFDYSRESRLQLLEVRACVRNFRLMRVRWKCCAEARSSDGLGAAAIEERSSAQGDGQRQASAE